VKNMALSSGPIGEYDVSRMAVEEDMTDVAPYRMFAVDADPLMPSNQPAIRFHNISSHSPELMDIYERFMKQADDVSGIPAYVLGNPQVAGAGRTLGGLSLLMGNAAKGIKKVIAHIDKDVVEPLVESYVHMNLLYNDDPTIKFDTEVVARGSSGLLQRELSQARSIEVLQMLTPYAQSGVAPKAGLQVVLRDVIRSLGYNADEIVDDPRREAQVEEFAQQAGLQQSQQPQPGSPDEAAPPEAQPSLTPATPAPALDGRSMTPQVAAALGAG